MFLKKITIGFYESLELEYSVFLKTYSGFYDLELVLDSFHSEWDFTPAYLDELKNFFFEKVEDLKNIVIEDEFNTSLSVEDDKIWQELIDFVEINIDSDLEESATLKKELDRFNSYLVCIPDEFKNLPVIDKCSKATTGQAIYSFTAFHPVTKKEVQLFELVNSRPAYSRKGNFQFNLFF